MKLSEFKNNIIYWLHTGQSWGSICANDDEEVEQLTKIIKDIGEDLKIKGVEPDSKKESNK